MTDTAGNMGELFKALAAAQAEMGAALKDSTNPHFKSKYADLASVRAACFPALNKHGISVIQRVSREEGERVVETILAHSSGATIRDTVPLIIGKNDMQGLGSAITYARRYGLMGMAGIAPDDDDGNAAAASAPEQDMRRPAQRITADQFQELRDMIERAGADEAKFAAFLRVENIEELPAARFADARRALQTKIDKQKEAPAEDKILDAHAKEAATVARETKKLAEDL